MPNQQKFPENTVLGVWSRPYQKFPKFVPICPFRFRRFETKPTDADHRPPPIIVLAAVWRADRPSPIIRDMICPDLRADPGKQTTPRSGDN